MRQTILIIVVVVLTLIALGQALTPDSTTSQTSNPTATAAVTTTTTITATAEPGTGSVSPAPNSGWAKPFLGFVAWLGRISTFVYTWFLELLKLVATLLALYVVVKLFQLLLGRQRQLVIEPFTNASSDDRLNAALPGLTILAREKLVRRIGRVQQELATYGGMQGLEDSVISSVLSQAPLPASVSDDPLKELIASLSELVPPEVKPAVPVIGVALPQTATHVTATLHQRGLVPGALGITYEIVDTERRRPALLRTWWEEPSSNTPQKAETNGLIRSVLTLTSDNTVSAGSQEVLLGQPLLWEDRLQAASYYYTGLRLHHANCYQEAVEYFQKALQLDPTRAQAAELLSESTARLQRQQSGQAAYAIGERLQSAGLLDAAIASYTQALLPIDQPNGASLWRKALNNSDVDASKAYLRLARLYRKPEVWLTDASSTLLKFAAAKGSNIAGTELEQIRHQEAEHLTHAAKLLLDLAQYTAAEKFLMQALDKVPEHAEAKTTLAVVKQSNPEEDDEVRALCAVAAIYEERGALQEAKEQYAEAVKKKPESDVAREGYKRLLNTSRTLGQRYNTLINNSVYWLAVELIRQEFLALAPSDRFATMLRRFRQILRRPAQQPSARPSRRLQHLAQVHNFFGALYLAEAPNFKPHNLEYLRLSQKAFEDAKAAWPTMYEFHENLGDALSMQAAESLKPEEKERNLKQALESYERAAKMWQEYNIQLNPKLLSSDTIGKRLTIDSATAWLRMKDLSQCVEAFKTINQIQQNTPPKAPVPPQPGSRSTRTILKIFQRRDKTSSSVHAPWLPEGETDVRLLYSLAVWYAIAAELPQEMLDEINYQLSLDGQPVTYKVSYLVRKARRYLAFALGRNSKKDYRYQAETDRDLNSIRTSKDDLPDITASSNPMHRLQDLFDQLDKQYASNSKFELADAETFKAAVEKILREIAWS